MILIIDDEPRYAGNYKFFLESNDFQVELQTNVDDALEFIEEKKDEIELIILDIMMSYGEVFNAEETKDGTRTGIQLYSRIREILPQIFILILTNVTDTQVEKRFEDEKRLKFYRKEQVKLEEFVNVVKSELRGKKV